MYKPYLTSQDRKVKSAFIGFVQKMPKETTYAITLQTHSQNMNWLPKTVSGKRQYFDKILSKWDRDVCRKFIGPNYHKPTRRVERQSGFAFPEKFDESPHYHLIVDIKNWNPEEYIAFAEEAWLDLWEPATVDIQHIYADKWEGYSMKDWDMKEPDSWIPIPYV